jgi:hypothetical protein
VSEETEPEILPIVWGSNARIRKGWSYPLTATDARKLFPQSDRVWWSSPPSGPVPESGQLLLLYWRMRKDWRPPRPTIEVIVNPVPSSRRSQFREALLVDAASEMTDWMNDLLVSDQNNQLLRHFQEWVWLGSSIECRHVS